jgi:redox-sensing transcriptional repressor
MPSLRPKQLSEPTVSRLPVYQRIGRELERRGIQHIDSADLGQLSGVAATTVRRDLAGLGSIGTRGAGYIVSVLIDRIDEVLGQRNHYDVIVVGMGNLGRAIVNSSNFLIAGAQLSGLYDVDPLVIGTDVAGMTVQDFATDLVPATMAVICTPAAAAQAVAERVVAAGTHAILNFAPQVLTGLPAGTAIRYVDFSIELQILAYHLTNGTGPLGGGLLRTLGLTTPVGPTTT